MSQASAISSWEDILGLCVEEHAEAGFLAPRAQHSGTQHTRWCSVNSRCIHMYKLTQAPDRALALLALNGCQEVWRGIIDERRVPGCSLLRISQAPVVLMPPLLNLICRIRTRTGQGQSGHARKLSNDTAAVEHTGHSQARRQM